MVVLNWICFILVCLDVVAYVIQKSENIYSSAVFIGMLIGIAARVYVLYNTATYWLLA